MIYIHNRSDLQTTGEADGKHPDLAAASTFLEGKVMTLYGEFLWRLFVGSTVLLFVVTAQAATFTVTNTGDSNVAGSGSLRRAVFDANAAIGSDVIEFAGGAFATPQIIVLTDNGDPVGTRSLTINNFNSGDLGTLTINGRGIVTVTRSTAPGTRDFGIFVIESAAIINDLTITNGSSLLCCGIGGGGIYINGENTSRGSLILNNSVVRDNFSTTNNGGGMYNGGGQVTINGCIISNNTNNGTQASGGGIFNARGNNNNGTLTINNSTITGNASGTTGGGVFNSGGTVNINSSNISNNAGGTASNGNNGGGGGIFNSAGAATITNSIINGNVRGGVATLGDNANLTVSDSTISNNTAVVGGSGISSSSVGGFTRITNSAISANTTNGTGLIGAAGITNTNSSSLFSLTNSTVSGNRVIGGLSDYAGGIYNGGNLTITNSTITDNEATGGSNARAGGVISASGGVTLTVRNSIIAGNRSNATIADVRNENGGTFTSSGFNLIGNRGAVTTFNQNGDQSGTGAAVLNPQLTPLANNGGPTNTHALNANSVAINAGSNALALDFNNQPLVADQRGFARIAGTSVDIGAFESSSSPILVPCPGPNLTPGFTTVPDVPLNIEPASAAIGDFNGDGIQDLATTNIQVIPDVTTISSLSVRFGNGTGGFGSATSPQIPLVGDPADLAIGDFNGDGKADFVTANNSTDNVSIRLGDGSGGFTTPATPQIPVGDQPAAIAAADFNGDGRLDIAVANDRDGTVSIRLGNGAGGFTSPPVPEVPVGVFFPISQAISIAIGDFNGDGKSDLAVGSGTNTSNAVSIRLGDGAGGFVSPAVPEVRFNSQVTSVALADFNSDGKLDFAVPQTSDNAGFSLNVVSIRLGDGTGGFTAPAVPNVPVGGAPDKIAIADFNGDGRADFAAAISQTVSIRLGSGSGGFTSPSVPEVSVGFIVVSIAIGDFNRDGRPDLAAAISSAASRVAIRLGNCATTPTATPTPTPTPTPTLTPTPTPVPSPTPVLFDLNANRNPSFFVWDNTVSAVGWYITPTVSLNLTKIETNFNPVIQTGSQNRTVTVEVLTDRRAVGGTLIRSASFDSAIARGTLGGGTFAPILLNAGTRYFIGFRNIAGIGTNTTQDTGATNCGACLYLDNPSSSEGQYQTRGGNDQPSVVDQPILRLIGAAASISISGRVTTPAGQGLRNAVVTLIDAGGIHRTATTSSFGVYQFDGVTSGQSVTLTVTSKRYRFSPQVRQITGNLINADFVGLE